MACLHPNIFSYDLLYPNIFPYYSLNPNIFSYNSLHPNSVSSLIIQVPNHSLCRRDILVAVNYFKREIKGKNTLDAYIDHF
jgi:hypothetical protein